MKGQKILFSFFSLILGFTMAISSYMMSVEKLNIYYDKPLSAIDILNTIFVSKNYKTLDYLDEKNVMLLLMPISFLFIGFIIGALSFLSKPKEYNCFICSRCNTFSQAIQIIYGKPIINIVLYSVSYFTILIAEIIVNCNYNKNMMLTLIGLCISKILILVLCTKIIFIVFQIYQSSIAVVSGLITIIIFYLVNMALTEINLVLFNGNHYCIENIFVSTILIVVVRIIEQFINNRRRFYVY